MGQLIKSLGYTEVMDKVRKYLGSKQKFFWLFYRAVSFSIFLYYIFLVTPVGGHARDPVSVYGQIALVGLTLLVLEATLRLATTFHRQIRAKKYLTVAYFVSLISIAVYFFPARATTSEMFGSMNIIASLSAILLFLGYSSVQIAELQKPFLVKFVLWCMIFFPFLYIPVWSWGMEYFEFPYICKEKSVLRMGAPIDYFCSPSMPSPCGGNLPRNGPDTIEMVRTCIWDDYLLFNVKKNRN